MSEAVISLGPERIGAYLERMKSKERDASTTGGGGGTYDDMEPRVAKLEADMTDIKILLARIDERTKAMADHGATKADLAEMETRLVGKIGTVEARVGVAEGELRRTLGAWQFVAVMIAAVGIIVKWPTISSALGI